MQESSFLVEQLSLAYQMKAPPSKQINSVDLKLVDKAKGQEHEGFELTENQTIRMSNHLSLSTFAKVSHRLRSMVLTPGDVFSCYGRLKVRIASQHGEEDSKFSWMQTCANAELRVRLSAKRKKFVMEIVNKELIV
jgi:hypothetical protein